MKALLFSTTYLHVYLGRCHSYIQFYTLSLEKSHYIYHVITFLLEEGYHQNVDSPIHA